MQAVAIDRAESTGRIEIPVRGHRFRDWLARIGRRLSFDGLENPPRSQRSDTAHELRIEVLLPGFRAPDIRVSSQPDRIAIAAEQTVNDPHNSETRVARLSMSIDGSIDRSSASADFRDGRLVVTLPKFERPKIVKIPVRAR